jgi:hypothetical protein
LVDAANTEKRAAVDMKLSLCSTETVATPVAVNVAFSLETEQETPSISSSYSMSWYFDHVIVSACRQAYTVGDTTLYDNRAPGSLWFIVSKILASYVLRLHGRMAL